MLVHDGLPIMAAGLPAMAAALCDEGRQAQVWNLHAERRAGLAPDLGTDLEGVRMLAISVQWFYQLPPALDLARRARVAGYGGLVVLGGFTASLWAEDLLERHAVVDAVVRGDGEEPLRVLAREIARGRARLSRVPNLAYRSRGRVRLNPIDYVGGEEEIDRLDFGRLELVRNLGLHLEHSSWRAITDGSPGVDLDLSATFYLCGGRGCSVACATCGGGRSAQRAHSDRRGVALRSPSRMADDVERAVAHGCTSIHACFDPDPNGAHWHGFMDEVSRRGMRLPMVFESFGLPDERFLARFAEVFAGGVVVISPETADEGIRRRIRGFPFSNGELERTLSRIGELDLAAQVFLGYLAPLEGREDLYRSRRWARRLAREHAGYTEVFHFPLSTDPGSPLALRPGRFGMRCRLRRPADWEEGLARQEPWLGNLLRHEPDAGGAELWRAVTLGVELEQACLRHRPRLHANLERRLGRDLDAFFTRMAAQVLASRDPSTLSRSRLVDVIDDLAPAGRAAGAS